MLAFSKFQPGDRVLDAGCGSGSFLMSLSKLGANVLALDSAPEHLVDISHRAGAPSLLVQGIVDVLPLASESLDGIWCANTLQFLDDIELRSALSEFKRVVRPGGLIAIKDVDMTAFKIAPASPFLGSHLAEACVTTEKPAKESHGSLRGRDLRAIMQAAGFRDVKQRSFLIERWGPLTGYEAAFWRDWLPYLADLAALHGVPEADLETWSLVSSPEAADAFIGRPDFYGCELQVVCIGSKAARL